MCHIGFWCVSHHILDLQFQQEQFAYRILVCASPHEIGCEVLFFCVKPFLPFYPKYLELDLNLDFECELE